MVKAAALGRAAVARGSVAEAPAGAGGGPAPRVPVRWPGVGSGCWRRVLRAAQLGPGFFYLFLFHVL